MTKYVSEAPLPISFSLLPYQILKLICSLCAKIQPLRAHLTHIEPNQTEEIDIHFYIKNFNYGPIMHNVKLPNCL